MADKPTTKPLTMLDMAMKYAEHGFKVYPLVPGGKSPHKGSNGHLQGTNDPETVKELFIQYGINSNIGISLIDVDIIILDIDLHTETASGFQSLQELEDAYEPLPETYTVSTPTNGGEHRYYRLPGMSMNKDFIDFRPGLDVLSTKIYAPPSIVMDAEREVIGSYTVKSGKITELANLPKFFIELLVQHERQKQSGIRYNYNQPSQGKKYTAAFLEELLAGQDDGNRNVWLTKQFGRMIALGMDYTAAYEWIKIVNQNFVRPPISAKRLNAIVTSIAKREQQKYEKLQERSE